MSETITSILKQNIGEILQEKSREVKIAEIEKELFKRGISEYTPGVLAGALKQLRGTQKYVSTSRGVYMYVAEKNIEYTHEKVDMSPSQQCYRVYEGAMQKIADIMNNVDIANCSEKEWLEVLKLRSALKEMKKISDQIAQK